MALSGFKASNHLQQTATAKWTPGPKGDRPPFGCCLLIWRTP